MLIEKRMLLKKYANWKKKGKGGKSKYCIIPFMGCSKNTDQSLETESKSVVILVTAGLSWDSRIAWEIMGMTIIFVVAMVSWAHFYMPKLIKLQILNMCRFLYTNYTFIKP